MERGARIVLRAPSVLAKSIPAEYKAPSLNFLQGTWHVMHSTLPMWKSKRNVRITYKLLEPSSAEIPREHTDRLDDVVTYQGLDSDKEHTVHGVDKASSEARDTWDWRGKGWLMIASSHWEILGWDEAGDNAWVVTYFAKTLFTPAGVDVYSRADTGLSAEKLQDIKTALASIEDAEFQSLADSLFEVVTDKA